ncbi:hypothetical protein ADU80_03835 [Clostridium botulinum]|uniref:Anti-sigma factor RsgI-like middle domain-containing protein n=2 Tax=Clostridium botulinum TaxID=1491 RepID=A0A9Q1UWI7_CLOBO|nr:conserved hypothetical protein [Clostridium botulinum BKT015925]KEI00648.1 hypothetical protein Z953_09700 [Clostridium botulinum D str. 16868]KEI05897.1 hypothetical protein Y848_00355 [Clostridium botulinum C/D str. Sp77]KLU75516.1 hypothetical protein CBC3_08435 [Clostridium botulinum V891]KOA78660.1 hypothetical protein ADU77_05575 [Clostridium botulinum]MCD3197166.1 anti-sigma factor domain-containing protein [Clostridium botulinum C/D]
MQVGEYMKRKTGVVVKVFKNYVSIKTVKGELFNVKIKDYTPNIGDIYSGTIIKKNSKTLNRLIALVILIALCIFGRNIYVYFSPKASITMNIPPTIQIKVNNWNKVVSVSATRKSGRELISNIQLKKLPLNAALTKIIETAKEKNIINDEYISNKDNSITVYTSINSDSMDLSSFEKYLKDRKIKYKINYDGNDKLK